MASHRHHPYIINSVTGLYKNILLIKINTVVVNDVESACLSNGDIMSCKTNKLFLVINFAVVRKALGRHTNDSSVDENINKNIASIFTTNDFISIHL